MSPSNYTDEKYACFSRNPFIFFPVKIEKASGSGFKVEGSGSEVVEMKSRVTSGRTTEGFGRSGQTTRKGERELSLIYTNGRLVCVFPLPSLSLSLNDSKHLEKSGLKTRTALIERTHRARQNLLRI